ncbi:MAG TPA: hypothetical protein VHL79_06365 [Ramlibacter sp.]|jgi:proteasome lid subunit RPN8/RPN11|nr:hypothetical protein [Ramlibacter sp.]
MTGRDHEVFALWTAPLEVRRDALSEVRVLQAIVPRQRPGRTAFGVYVHIPGEELQRIQLENYARGERSIIQLHTHPGADVSMSDLDREWEVTSHVGALSIIVPDYCAQGLRLFDGANIYEREEDHWRLWSAQEAAERMQIT